MKLEEVFSVLFLCAVMLFAATGCSGTAGKPQTPDKGGCECGKSNRDK
jgi:hypothetical protein